MHKYLIKNKPYFDSLLQAIAKHFFENKGQVFALINNKREIIYSSWENSQGLQEYLEDTKTIISNLYQPKLISKNNKGKFVIPVNLSGEAEYYIIIDNDIMKFDSAVNSFSIDEKCPDFLCNIGFFYYIINLLIKSIGQEFQVKDNFSSLSSIITFRNISYDKEKLDSSIKGILLSLVEMTQSSFSLLYILDPNDKSLKLSNYAGDISDEIMNLDISVLSQMITNYTWQGKDIVRIRVDSKYEEYFQIINKIDNSKIRNYLGIPIKAEHEYMGIIELYSREENKVFSKEDESLCILISNYISILYKNFAYLYQEKLNREKLQITNKELIKDKNDHTAFVHRLNSLYKIIKVIKSVINIDEMIKRLIEALIAGTGADEVFIFLKDEYSDELVLQGCPKEYLSSVGFVRIPFGEGIEGIVAKTKKTIAVSENVINDPRYKSILDLELKFFNSLLAEPITVQKDKLIGVLELRYSSKKEYTPSEKKLISIFSDQIGIAIENALLHKKTELLSLTDDMTGLYNFRYFQQKIKDEIIRSKRYQRDLSLLMMDIDHFKVVNDTYGHTRGDIILKMVSDIIRITVRDVDISARYGGEEFVVILPETAQKDTIQIAERIRRRVEDIDFSNIEGLETLRITISIGVASFPENASTEKSLIEAADKACYFAKKTGRNRVVGYSSI